MGGENSCHPTVPWLWFSCSLSMVLLVLDTTHSGGVPTHCPFLLFTAIVSPPPTHTLTWALTSANSKLAHLHARVTWLVHMSALHIPRDTQRSPYTKSLITLCLTSLLCCSQTKCSLGYTWLLFVTFLPNIDCHGPVLCLPKLNYAHTKTLVKMHFLSPGYQSVVQTWNKVWVLPKFAW